MNPKTADRPLVLTEYDSAQVKLTADQERVLRHLARGRITMLPGDTADSWRITTSSYVGTIVTPDARILIRPKVGTANLFYLLEASGKPVDIGPAVFEYDKSHDLIPSFATFFARHLEKALGRGVHRAYQEVLERLPGIRGRVDLPAQLRLAGVAIPVESRYDEYTADTQLNRILRSSAVRLLRLPGVTLPTRLALQRLAGLLEEAGPLRPGDLHSAVVFTRLNAHCQPAERLARMVLANETLLDSVGMSGAGAFLVDMNKAFEEFVAVRLSSYLAGRLSVVAQRTQWLDVDKCVEIRPDLVFERATGGILYVADTKYKITSDGFGRDADYYQALAYATALGVPEAMLIYCQRDGTVPPTEVRVGTRRARLATWALTLSGTPSHVEQCISELASQIAARIESEQRNVGDQ